MGEGIVGLPGSVPHGIIQLRSGLQVLIDAEDVAVPILAPFLLLEEPSPVKELNLGSQFPHSLPCECWPSRDDHELQLRVADNLHRRPLLLQLGTVGES
jgi:hypothetical protein